jgi:hypothetical protein
LIGCILCSGSSSAFVVSVSKASFCGNSIGLNVYSKCCAKLFTFSLLLRAEGWSAFLIGGMRCVVVFFFNLLLHSRIKSRCQQMSF